MSDNTASSEGSLENTVSIVSAYVANNSVPQTALADLIAAVHTKLQSLRSGDTQSKSTEPLFPAVSIKKSVTPDYIICLEDGKQFKSLKRHIGKFYDLTPEQYRVKWSLPDDYPMVAPAYAERRSAIAIASGLGRKAGETVAKLPTVPKRRGPAKAG